MSEIFRNHGNGKRSSVFWLTEEAPLLSRGGESRRGSGGWGGAGQQNHSLDQHHS